MDTNQAGKLNLAIGATVAYLFGTATGAVLRDTASAEPIKKIDRVSLYRSDDNADGGGSGYGIEINGRFLVQDKNGTVPLFQGNTRLDVPPKQCDDAVKNLVLCINPLFRNTTVR